MSLLSYTELEQLVDTGVISLCEKDLINGSSIDVRLGNSLLIERRDAIRTVSYSDREPLAMYNHDLNVKPYVLRPGEFILAHTIERFDLPLDLSCEYKLKSSMGRIGLDHATAGWVDPGFRGSLTLEITNNTKFHSIELRYGDRIGQITFHRHTPVPYDKSYAVRGRYNDDASVSQIKP